MDLEFLANLIRAAIAVLGLILAVYPLPSLVTLCKRSSRGTLRSEERKELRKDLVMTGGGFLIALLSVLQIPIENRLTASLEERVYPRRFSQKTWKATVSMLEGEPKGLARIECVKGDQEGFEFAIQISQILTQSGWVVRGIRSIEFVGNPKGLLLAYRAKQIPPHGRALIDAFGKAGFHVQAGSRPDDPELADENVVLIIVGNKPF